MTDLLKRLQERVAAAIGELPGDVALPLQPPKDRRHGDVALACFPLAKLRGQAPPAVAAELAAALTPDEDDELLESAAAAGPFVNFRFRRSALAHAVVGGILADEPPFGPAAATGTSIVIDYSSPNIAKPFHMGHLRSTVIGAALCRIHRHLGNTVHGINHLGDWGAQFGKILTAFRRWGSEAELARDPMRHLFEVYVRYGAEAAKDPALDRESIEHFQRLESGEDNEERRLWQRLRDESLRAFQSAYDRLGVQFDHVTGESFYEDKMDAAIERIRAAGIATVSEGAEVVDLSDRGMPPCILRKSDGTTIYATRDLAAIFYRMAEYRFDRALYVVGAEQKLHFRQLVAVLEKMGLPEASRIEHVPFGLILARNEQTGKWEKFATRGGNAVFLDEVLDEAVARARRIIAEKNPNLEDADAVAEQVGVSAIIFNDLKAARIKDVRFDLEAMTNFDGETGPYVQYAVARLSSILAKARADSRGLTGVTRRDGTGFGESGENGERAEPDWRGPTAGGTGFGESGERAELTDVDYALLADADEVLLAMLDFGPALQRAAAQNEPSVITGFAIQIAGAIHSYLRDHHVLRAEPALRRARLALVAASVRLLETALRLIGVATPKRM